MVDVQKYSLWIKLVWCSILCEKSSIDLKRIYPWLLQGDFCSCPWIKVTNDRDQSDWDIFKCKPLTCITDHLIVGFWTPTSLWKSFKLQEYTTIQCFCKFWNVCAQSHISRKFKWFCSPWYLYDILNEHFMALYACDQLDKVFRLVQHFGKRMFPDHCEKCRPRR